MRTKIKSVFGERIAGNAWAIGENRGKKRESRGKVVKRSSGKMAEFIDSDENLQNGDFKEAENRMFI